jgi:hypothetical protein
MNYIVRLGVKRRNGHKPGDMCGVTYIDGENIFTSPSIADCGEPAYRGWRCKKHWNEFLGIKEDACSR